MAVEVADYGKTLPWKPPYVMMMTPSDWAGCAGGACMRDDEDACVINLSRFEARGQTRSRKPLFSL